jgi:hypothetical protein
MYGNAGRFVVVVVVVVEIIVTPRIFSHTKLQRFSEYEYEYDNDNDNDRTGFRLVT